MGDTKAVENNFLPQNRVVNLDGAGTILFGQGLCLVINGEKKTMYSSDNGLWDLENSLVMTFGYYAPPNLGAIFIVCVTKCI